MSGRAADGAQSTAGAILREVANFVTIKAHGMTAGASIVAVTIAPAAGFRLGVIFNDD